MELGWLIASAYLFSCFPIFLMIATGAFALTADQMAQ
jgi:hypothetical protein